MALASRQLLRLVRLPFRHGRLVPVKGLEPL
jgi:hypothetical protein